MEPKRHAGQDRNDAVVPVSADNPLLSEALRAVEAQAQALGSAGPLPAAFCHWAMGEGFAAGHGAQLAAELSDEVAGSGRSIQAVAALGFLLAIEPALPAACRGAFAQGVDWLTGRVGGLQSSMVSLLQPVAQTGVQVGLLAVADTNRWQKLGTWVESVLTKRSPGLEVDAGWRHELLSLVERRSKNDLADTPTIVVATSSEAVYVARGLLTPGAVTNREFVTRLLGRIQSVLYAEPEAAVLDLAAFRFLAQTAQIDLRAPSLEDVALLLRRIPSGLRRWTWEAQKKTPTSTAQKWAVENEYHFQNLLCALLSPVFPDLRDEEWLASVGQKRPRADLVLPSLHLVIEVKYWREKSSPQDLISQIGEDVSLYLKVGSPYRKVLPIVWDQARRTEQYDLLISGLSQIRDVVTPVIIAQPAFMESAANGDASGV
ncbi:MAG: hypothetical protein H6933_16180 [Burkholderiaceae bacterium]|nr:hypothetical protein [Burkholderiaceae bacterium]